MLFARAGMCLLGTAALALPPATQADAQSGLPIVIRGIPSVAPAATELQLAYQASFPNGSLDSSIDKLGIGTMLAGDTGIADSNPIIEKRPGELFLSITRPVGLAPDQIEFSRERAAESVMVEAASIRSRRKIRIPSLPSQCAIT